MLGTAGEAIWVRAVRAYAVQQLFPDTIVDYP